MSSITALRVNLAAALTMSCLPLVAAEEGPLAQKKGQGGSEIQGSALGPGRLCRATNGLEHCEKPMGARGGRRASGLCLPVSCPTMDCSLRPG